MWAELCPRIYQELPHPTDCDLLTSIKDNEILKALQHFMGQCNNFWVFEELILNNFDLDSFHGVLTFD